MFPTPDRYGQAVRAGGTKQYPTVSAYLSGVALVASLPVDGGDVQDDVTAPGVRRTMRLNVAKQPGLADTLARPGVQLRASWTVDYGGGIVDSIPLGVFEPDVQTLGYAPGGGLSVTAPDGYRRVQLAKFLIPRASTPGMTVAGQIIQLLREALPVGTQIVNLSTSQATVGALTWDRDRDKAIEDLAESIGAYVFMDRNGAATIADLPTSGVTPVWTVDASMTGVLLDADRSRSRTETRNVVVVTADKADGVAPFEPVIVWDQDPSSPTYAGVDPLNQPGTAGPLGIAPDFYSSPLLLNAQMAEQAGRTRLAKTVGQVATLSVSSVPHRGLDGLDAIDVLLPRDRNDQPRVMERHLIDKVTHPLDLSAQSIDTRSISAVRL